jgi:hypothetical protein
LAEQVITELASNPLTTFVTLLDKEQENQDKQKTKEKATTDPIVGGTQCVR